MSTFVITTKGQVRNINKLLPNEKYDYNVFGIPNSFDDKEQAYIVRDNIIDQHPKAFLDNQLTTTETETNENDIKLPSKAKDVSQEEWRNITRRQVLQHYKTFWTEWAKLKPKDKCDLYLKMVQYAFSHAPSEKPLDQDDLQKIQDRKQQDIEQSIAAGIPDQEFDE